MFYRRPELVPDEKGRFLPALTDEYLSAALFDVITNAVRAIAAWNYIFRLLQLLDGLRDKLKRALILDEQANACDLEYRRAQAALKRQMCAPVSFAGKSFKRISTAQDLGIPRITMKGRPSDWTVADPQLHYVLQLCHPDTSAKQSVDWIQKLDDHHARFEEDRARLMEHEAAALGDLAVVVGFVQAMSAMLPLNPSRKKAQRFVSRSTQLDAELNRIKPQANFGDFVVPMDNILEPGVASAALQALDSFVIDNTGEKLGLLYQDLVEDSLTQLEEAYHQAKAKADCADKTTYVPLPPSSSQPARSDEPRRTASQSQKEKTRGISQAYDVTARPAQPPAPEAPRPKLTVKASTAGVFATLFAKSDARGAIARVDFEAALADVGFYMTPKGGSVYRYNPPDSMAAMMLINLHRPHRSIIEGYPMLILARRLTRRYGWDEDTSLVA